MLRLDGDLYDSTCDALDALYPRLSIGGYAMVDDYGTYVECRRAVHDYLERIGANSDIKPTDNEAVYWKKLDDGCRPQSIRRQTPDKRLPSRIDQRPVRWRRLVSYARRGTLREDLW